MFGFASVFPRNYVGAACFGLGLSGLLSFSLWMMLSKLIFDMTPAGVKAACWLYFSLATLVNVAAGVFFYSALRKPWAIASVQHAKEERSAKKQRESAGPARSKWNVFKDASEQIFNVSFTLWLTLMMFPNVAPFAWGRSVVEADMLVGLVQCGDFIGRYIPNLRRWIPQLTVRPHRLKYIVLARLVFIPLLVLPAKQSIPLVHNFGFQAICIFLFALSSGWICSLASMYVPESVQDADEKSQAATMYLLMLLLGITIGVWMAKLWTLF